MSWSECCGCAMAFYRQSTKTKHRNKMHYANKNNANVMGKVNKIGNLH